MGIKQINIGFIKRNAIRRGPTSSEAWNDSFDEILTDLTNLSSSWNNTLYPLLITLPSGTNDLDAFTNGLDGRTIYTNSAAISNVNDQTYFNTIQSRPKSIKEQFDHVYNRITSVKDELLADITNISGGLTDAQKDAIGAHIFDNTATSGSTSIDGKSENNRLNITQIGRDVYGTDFVLGNNGTPILTNSVKDMVDALLAIHNGNWSDDVSLSHSGIGGDFLADGSVPMTGQFLALIGSAATPGITFNGHSTTGLYWTSNALNIAINGTNRVTFSSTTNSITGDTTITGAATVSSTLTTQAAIIRKVVEVSTDVPSYTITATDDIVLVSEPRNIGNPNIEIYLPLSPTLGRTLVIKDSGGANVGVTISINGNGNTIDGSLTYVIDIPYASITTVWTGSEWSII